MNRHSAEFEFDNSFARDMDGFYIPWKGEVAPEPEMLLFNVELAAELGLDPSTLSGDLGARVFSGGEVPDGATPIAQAYAGHQFGHFSAQLGDGRALLLGEIIDRKGQRRDLQLKGSGRTPFSRGGDGKAVLGPVLREYLMGEAMHALGIPTTRALAAVTTGEEIMREGPEHGAVLTRVASSHLRVGTFQFFAARGEQDKVKKLADHAIARHYPHLEDAEDKYLAFLSAVIGAQVALVARWSHVGFVHGVMNTDNMTISGETIDYGPCAFIDAYDPGAVFSSIDASGRYAFGNQPVIAQWNLARLAETLLDLIDPEDDENAIRLATNAVNAVPDLYARAWLDGMRRKIGLMSEEADDAALVSDLLSIMKDRAADYTRFFRDLAEAADGASTAVSELFGGADLFSDWLKRWQNRCARDPQSPSERRVAMDRVNPVYIPRNHMVEDALIKAREGDLSPFHRLLGVLADPYVKRDGLEEYALPHHGTLGTT